MGEGEGGRWGSGRGKRVVFFFLLLSSLRARLLVSSFLFFFPTWVGRNEKGRGRTGKGVGKGLSAVIILPSSFCALLRGLGICLGCLPLRCCCALSSFIVCCPWFLSFCFLWSLYCARHRLRAAFGRTLANTEEVAGKIRGAASRSLGPLSAQVAA